MKTRKVAEKEVVYRAASKAGLSKPSRARSAIGSVSQPLIKQAATAKIFMNGRSQAVRLPKAFRFDTDEVLIERQGDAVVLRPVMPHTAWVDRLRTALEGFQFEPDFELERPEPLPRAKREELFP